MAHIAIAVKHVTPGLKDKLDECMFFFRAAGHEVALEEKKIGQWPHLLCLLGEAVPDDHAGFLVFRRLLAKSLTDYLVMEQAAPYLEDILSHYYFYFPKEERQRILEAAEKIYVDDETKNAGGQIYAEVSQLIKEYFEGHDYANLHGLITFRMHPWLNFLRKVVDRAVDQFLMEKEYQEFIKLLKYFVTLQEPKINQVHVTLDENGSFVLLDQQHQPVERDASITWEHHEGSADAEDQLVSMLISAAPHQVVLHKHVYTQFPKAVDTLKHVFENRVTLCKRCKLCHDVSRKLNLKNEP